MTLNNPSLWNLAFYNPEIGKFSQPTPLSIECLSKYFNIPIKKIKPLQFSDKETKEFMQGARVFKVKTNRHYKVRMCNNEDEAKSVFERSQFAFKIGIPTPRPLFQQDSLVVFEYIQGRQISLSERASFLQEIAKVQNTMNKTRVPNVDEGLVERLTKGMIDQTLFQLGFFDQTSARVLKDKLAKKPALVPVYDHQDYGIHNLLLTGSRRIIVTDEESYGILPLGYGIIRPIFDRENYRIVDDKDPVKYLKFFDAYDYLMENLSFFRSLFIMRNSYRRFKMGNHKGARALLGDLSNYE